MSEPVLDPAALLAQQSWVEELARGLVRDSSLAQDLAQEAWLLAARKGPEDGGALRGFLRGIVNNLRRSEARARARRERREATAARPEALPSAAELVERAELQRLLVESVLALDEGERTAILLRYFENLSAEEIARRAGLPAGTVRSRLARGLERLRERLEARVERRDLLALLVVLGRLPPAGSPALPPSGPAAAAHAARTSALPWIGGLLTMKALLPLAAGCAALLSLATGLWWVGRDSAREPRAAGEARGAAAGLAAPVEPAAPLAGARAAAAPQRTALDAPRGAAAAPAPVAVATPAARVLARVIDEEGRALAGAEVFQGDRRVGASGALGEVELELPTEHQVPLTELQFRRAGFARAARRARLTPGSEIYLGDVALVPAAVLRGRVEDERGAGIGGAHLMTAGLENPRTDPEELRRIGPLEEEGSLQGESAADGSFELADVPLGPLRLWAGRADLAWSSSALSVTREGLHDLRLTLRPLDQSDRIRGRVLSPEGAPVGGAEIRTWYTAANIGSGGILHAEADGRFEILLEQRVAYDLTISDPENRWSELYRFAVEPGTRDLELVFEPARWIDVRAGDPDGAPLASFTLGLEGALDGHALEMKPRMEPIVDGHTRLRVPGAPFRVTADALGREHLARGPFEPARAPASLALELAALPGIRGIVRTPAGEPAANAQVGLYRAVGDQLVVEKNGLRLTTEAWTRTGRPPTPRGASCSIRPPPAPDASSRGCSCCAPSPRATRDRARAARLRSARGRRARARARPRRRDRGPGADGARRRSDRLLVGFHRGDGDIRTVRLGPDGRFGSRASRPDRGTCARWTTSSRATARARARPSTPRRAAARAVELHGGRRRDHAARRRLQRPRAVHAARRAGARGRTLAGWSAALERPDGDDQPWWPRCRWMRAGASSSWPRAAAATGSCCAGPRRRADAWCCARARARARARRAGAWRCTRAPGGRRGARARHARALPRLRMDGSVPGHALKASVRIVPDADGRFVLATVPEGRGKISRNDPPGEGQEFAPWEVLSEFELAPGEVRHVDLP
jgi:RNA polymerase sigma-70 factor (ECF subfamily)